MSKPKHPPGPPMTLGNVRELVVSIRDDQSDWIKVKYPARRQRRGDRMNADELYTALSERITADAMRHGEQQWPDYYNGLRGFSVVSLPRAPKAVYPRTKKTHSSSGS